MTGEQVHRLRDVLRLGVGDQIVVLDYTGLEHRVRIVDITPEAVKGDILAVFPSASEPTIRITLYQALLKGGGFEVVLQKCTEVGVVAFVPVVCERCVVKGCSSARLDRWRRIVTEAAEQSRRGTVPEVCGVVRFEEACGMARGRALLLWEGEGQVGLKRFIRRSPVDRGEEISVFIGAEGGFTGGEVGIAQRNGIVPVGLGRRILRAETAGLATAAAIMYEYGELGG